MHTASWCFRTFLKWNRDVTFNLCAKTAGARSPPMRFHIVASSLELHAPSNRPKLSEPTFRLARINRLTRGLNPGNLEDFARLCLPPSLSRGRRDFFACSTGFLWHSSNHVCPILICMPSVNPSLDAFVYITSPSFPQCDSTFNPATARIQLQTGGSQTRNPYSNPVTTILLRLHFFFNKLFVPCSSNGSAADLRGL